MEDNNLGHAHEDKSMHPNCNCAYCRMGGHKYMVLRLVLGLIILGMVFCLGMKIGEFKGEFAGHRHHGSYGHKEMMRGGMMDGHEKETYILREGTQAAPAMPAAPAAPQPMR